MKIYNVRKNKDGKIFSVFVNFGNEIFKISYVESDNWWIMWRKEKNALPFTSGLWLLNVVFDSLREAKKFIRDRKFFDVRTITYDEISPQKQKNIFNKN